MRPCLNKKKRKKARIVRQDFKASKDFDLNFQVGKELDN